MSKSSSYRDSVYKMLYELNGEFRIVEKVNPQNLSEFIQIVKDYINLKTKNQVEFSSDYAKIRSIK